MPAAGVIVRVLRSFRGRLMLLMLVAALPAFAALLYYSLWLREHTLGRTEAQTLEFAQALAAEYQERIEQTRLQLAAMSRIPGVNDGRGADCAAQLDAMRRQGPDYIDNLFAIAPDGAIICSAAPLPAGINVAERVNFRKALPADGFGGAEFVISPRSGKPVVVLTHTVRRADRPVAVLGAALDLSRLSSRLPFDGALRGTAYGSYVLLDRQGVILLHSPEPARIGARITTDPSWPELERLLTPGTLRAKGADGVERLFAAAPVGAAHFVVGLDADAAAADADTLLLPGLLGLAGACLMGLAIGWFGGNDLVLRPMQRIFAAVRRVAAGELDARTGAPADGSEIGQLAAEVDHMAATLAGRDREQRAALRRSRLQMQAIDAVAMSGALRAGDIEGLAREITELAVSVTGVERANVWLFNADETELACIDGYEATPARHSAGARRHEAEFAAEFAALKNAPYVDANDPLHDPRTAGYGATYLKPLGITAMLDAVIHVGARHLGVLCLEHVGRSHRWEQDEIAFACHLADKLALADIYRQNHRAEAALRREGERAQAYLDIVGVMVMALDRNGDIALSNRKACQVLGCGPEDSCAGANFFARYVPQEQRRARRAQFDQLIAGAQPFAERSESQVLTAVGARRLIAWTSTPVRNEDGTINGVLSAGEDITERVQFQEERERLQSQLQQAQKMEALGQLTGGIAHDFNNILASVLGFAKLALHRHVPDKDSELGEYLGEVVAAGERARELVARMMAFGRSRPGHLAVAIDPLPVARDSVKLLSATIPASIRIETRFEPELPDVLMDPVDFHQVLMNLVINARDALGGKGRIAISLARRHIDDAICATCHERFSGNYLELAVRDDGAGIAPDALGRIFEPFFTTKEVGKGTGMGLAVVHGLVRRAGGHFQVHSAVGQGTDFHVLIPVAARTPALPPALPLRRPPADEVRGPRHGRVLVVDDEAVICALLTDLLEDDGWQVSSFGDPLAALAAVRQAPQIWAAAITDQTMPNMTGDELIEALRALRPDLPIILCTGYSERIDADRARAAGASRFFYKPLDGEELLAALAEVVAANEHAA